ncbi:MAG TPA: CGNR zinc finger domain-containing protein [Actinomycetes bacterium]
MHADATPDRDLPPEELRFIFRSGRLSLAFCATVGERWRRNFERLRTPGDLARWYVEAGLVDAPVATSQSGLRRARVLREAVYRIARALIAGQPPASGDEEIVNAAARAPAPVPQMHRGEATRLVLARGAEAAMLSLVARDAIELFTSPSSRRIRKCANHQCGLLFVDLSRPGRRRWCSSAACGGRERAARYRRRRTNPAPAGPASTAPARPSTG